MEAKQERLVASCEISDIKLVEDGPKGLQSFVTYHIRSEFTNGTSHMCVRRYSDFEWLHKTLEAEHPGTLIPPIPTKDAFCVYLSDLLFLWYSVRFSHEVVHYRRRQFGRFLSRLISHPTLSQSKSIEVFLSATEEQFAAQKAASPSKTSGDETISTKSSGSAGGVAAASAFFNSMLNTVTHVATNLTIDVQEVDSSFADKQDYLMLLRERLEVLLNATEQHIQRNTDLVEQTVALTKRLESLEGYERKDYPELSEHFAKLRDVELGIADLHQRRVQNEIEMFEDPLRENVAWTIAAERLLNNRSAALKAYQVAQATTRAKQEKVDAGQGGELATAELQKAKDTEAQCKTAFEDLSVAVKQQVEEYNGEKSIQLRVALRELARENIEFGEQSIALWKDLGKSLDK